MQVKFTHYDLGDLDKGRVIEVELVGSAANVQLLCDEDYERFKAGKSYKYHGGLVTKSPVRLRVPVTGHWHVTIDLRGLTGTVESVVRTLPDTLPEYKRPHS